MPYFHLTLDNRHQFAASLTPDSWIVACLCADWCGTCKSYQAPFAALAERFPECQFLWLDIEDHADLTADLDIENFPTLLIQRGEETAFFGTMLPEIALAQRLIEVQLATDPAQINKQHRAVQAALGVNCNLRQWLRDAGVEN
ncbi:MAG: thioredoxin family protein [Burkholderiales bacterium]|nr:thioredoxin family protein [Burkholderiales bacterium]